MLPVQKVLYGGFGHQGLLVIFWLQSTTNSLTSTSEASWPCVVARNARSTISFTRGLPGRPCRRWLFDQGALFRPVAGNSNCALNEFACCCHLLLEVSASARPNCAFCCACAENAKHIRSYPYSYPYIQNISTVCFLKSRYNK